MKKIISIILCLVVLNSVFSTTAFASTNSGIMPCLNNVNSVESTFIIDNGEAYIRLSYFGYNGLTAETRITTVLQKKSFIFFWKDINEWVDLSTDVNAIIEHTYPVSSGTYRVKIKYEISGSGGQTDVIEEELEYKN